MHETTNNELQYKEYAENTQSIQNFKRILFEYSIMAVPSSPPITVRFPPGLLRAIDEEIENYEEFTNRTEFIVCAVRSYLDELKNTRGGGEIVIIDRWAAHDAHRKELPVQYL